jgi:DNA-binding NarL/FixJ family response regulator
MLDGLRAILEKAGIEVVGEASTGHEAIAAAKRLHPNLVLMDIAMRDLNGVDATRRLLRELPGLKVVAVSMSSDRRYVTAMLEAGAVGYVLKNEASDALLKAVHAAMSGVIFLSPSLAAEPSPAPHRQRETPSGLKAVRPLTPREREVLQLLAEGKSSKEIAELLEIGLPTVETHRRQLMTKLNLRTVAELTKYAIREGLTSVDP